MKPKSRNHKGFRPTVFLLTVCFFVVANSANSDGDSELVKRDSKYRDGRILAQWTEKKLPGDSLVKHGEWKRFQRNGLVELLGSYVDGKKEGIWRFYDASGKINFERVWKNDSMVSQETWSRYTDGKMKYHSKSVAGRREGKWSYLDWRGETLWEQEYVNGECVLADKDYRILLPGCFHGPDVCFPENEHWYGLFREDTISILRPVKLDPNPCFYPITDYKGETSGVSIGVDNPHQPLFFLTSPQPLDSGMVPTFSDAFHQMLPGEAVHLGKYYLAALGSITDEGFRPANDLLISHYQIKLYDRYKEGSQTLLEYERTAYDGIPVLMWAGDLNGDKQIDLLLDIRNHYGVRHYVLYMSSEKLVNRFVRLVASMPPIGD